ncbi:unnamed protein product [Victoria cruziana]
MRVYESRLPLPGAWRGVGKTETGQGFGMGFASVAHMASAISAASSSSFLLRGRSFGAPRLQSFFPGTFLARTVHHSRSLTCTKASSDEEASARAAASTAESGAPTIFDKIIAKEIPSTIVYEDDRVLAFRDIDPQSPSHILLIPKIRDGLTQLSKAEPRHVDILGHLLYAAKLVAEKEGLSNGYRVVINNGPDGCQSVYHLHLHILGGRQMKWPPG